jgi:hypothetical protein
MNLIPRPNSAIAQNFAIPVCSEKGFPFGGLPPRQGDRGGRATRQPPAYQNRSQSGPAARKNRKPTEH